MNESGQLVLKGEHLEYKIAPSGRLWSLALSDVVALGEYTTDHGPYADDYFLVFVTVANGNVLLHESSFYAHGRDDALTAIGNLLGAKIDLGLCNSAQWKSRVLFPTGLIGEAFYTFAILPASTVRDKLKKLLFINTLRLKISPAVWNHIESEKVLRNGRSAGTEGKPID